MAKAAAEARAEARAAVAAAVKAVAARVTTRAVAVRVVAVARVAVAVEERVAEVMEAVAAGCLPAVPDRLVYPELYPAGFRYAAGEGEAARLILRLREQLRAGTLARDGGVACCDSMPKKIEASRGSPAVLRVRGGSALAGLPVFLGAHLVGARAWRGLEGSPTAEPMSCSNCVLL